MNKEFWSEYYENNKIEEPSPFAQYILEHYLKEGDTLVDIGCGDGRDLYYFKKHGIAAHGVDQSNEDVSIIKQPIMDYIAENKPPKHVYARFFWHAIEREEQLAILDWVKGFLYIEARTTTDKPKNVIGRHKRKLVDTAKLYKDLENKGFTIISSMEGYGMSPFRGEDPHLVRVIAQKQ